MEDLILFVQDNYVWFIVFGVLAVMAVIGYYADKTDFGRQDKARKPKAKKVKKQKIKKEPVVDPAIEEATSSNPSINDILGSFTPSQEVTEETVEPVFHNIEESSSNDMSVKSEIDDVEELEPVTLESDNIESPMEETLEPVAPVEPIQEDLYVGLDGTPNAYTELNPIPEVKEISEENDEDVWKF